jgi:hypothetical protein
MKASIFYVKELTPQSIQAVVLADYQSKLDAISLQRKTLLANLEEAYKLDLEALDQEFSQLVQARDALRENYVVMSNRPVDGGYEIEVLI